MTSDLLVLEDDEPTASFLKFVLEDEGFQVRVASTMIQARRLLREALPELLILDRHLPDGDGLALCSELRADPAAARVPILFLSAARSRSEVVDGYGAGGDDYMAKPFEFTELVGRVQALLRRGGATYAASA